MPITTPSRMQVVRKEEKETRLQDFIRQELAELGDAAAGVRCMILARSPDSPVARAVAAFASELDSHKIAPRVIFSSVQGDGTATPSAGADWLKGCNLCFVRHPQLIDAHELLVMGHQASWIGDSMRRDPQKRDAYECYTRSSAPTAETTARSFEQIWQRSETAAPPAPKTDGATSAKPADTLPPADLQTPAPVEVAQPPTPGATRH